MDATTLYYTFSTIAQTLAAAFAFVGAFVLFRLQGINQEIESIMRRIIDKLDYVAGEREDYDEGMKTIGSKEYETYFKRVENLYLKVFRSKSSEDFKSEFPECEWVRKNVEEKNNLKLSFRNAALLIGVTIILSVTFLPFCKILVTIPYIWPVLILILIIVLTIISIISSIRLIFRTLSLKFTKKLR